MNTLFLSDPHLDHKNICKFRTQFTTSQDHDLFIKDNYFKIVKPKDHVWFLGDVAFSLEALKDLKSWPGIKHIILGNHDGDSDSRRNYQTKDLLEVFKSVHGITSKYHYWISHAPIHTDELRGKYNLHGHIHNHIINDDRYMNLCMEHIDYTPISLEQIRNKFKARNLL